MPPMATQSAEFDSTFPKNQWLIRPVDNYLARASVLTMERRVGLQTQHGEDRISESFSAVAQSGT
jgi:hypothetical protein